jgi:hypothetical protein
MGQNDLPNFAAWSNKNLADFATEAYIRMQEQQEALEELRNDLKFAMSELRKGVILEHKDGYKVVVKSV